MAFFHITMPCKQKIIQTVNKQLRFLVGNYTYFNANIIGLFSNQVKHLRHILKSNPRFTEIKKRQYTYIGAKIMSDMHIEEHFSPFRSNQCLARGVLQRRRAQKTLSGHDAEIKNINKHQKCEVISQYKEVSALQTALVGFIGPMFQYDLH